MEKGGVSPRRGTILVGLMVFLYGITAFIYEHGMRISMFCVCVCKFFDGCQ